MLSLLLPCAFSCCLLEMEVSTKVPSDVLIPSLLDPWSRFSSCLKSDAEGDGGPGSSFVSPLRAPQFLLALEATSVLGFKGGMMCFVKSRNTFWLLPSQSPVISALGECQGLARLLHCFLLDFPVLDFFLFYFFCLQIHLFNICESSIWSSSTRAFHFLQCLVLQPLTFQDFP